MEDFDKLPKKWSDIKNYYFVYNDRYAGVPAPLASELQQLKNNKKLDEASAIAGAKLEEFFMGLSPDMRQLIVGGIPSNEISFVDSRNIGELLSHLANKDSGQLSFLNEEAPDFSKKNQINGLTEPIATNLKTFWYQTSTVDDFLSPRDVGLSQSISKEIASLYEESKVTIPDSQKNYANLRYIWMVEELIPASMRETVPRFRTTP